MAIAVSYVQTQVSRIFNDLTDQDFLDLLNESDQYLQLNVRLVPQSSPTVITLVAGTQYYALPSAMNFTWSGYYTTGANNSAVTLYPTTMDYLDYQMPGWRVNNGGTPTWFFFDGPNVGFYPTPQLSTSGGYPVVQFFQTLQPALYTLSSTLPPVVHSSDAWVYNVCARWAVANHPDRAEGLFALAKIATQELQAYMRGRNIRRKPKFIPRIPQVRFV